MAAKRMVASGARPGEIVVVRLAYGDLLLESIQEICKQQHLTGHIRNESALPVYRARGGDVNNHSTIRGRL